MTAAIILVASLVLLGVAVAVFSGVRSGDTSNVVVQADSCATCNGSNEKCEQECMLEAAINPVEYYNDEELDRYIGRSGDAYTDEEAECFRDVLYTMEPNEVAGWSRSLTLRGITPPNQMRDELLLMIKG